MMSPSCYGSCDSLREVPAELRKLEESEIPKLRFRHLKKSRRKELMGAHEVIYRDIFNKLTKTVGSVWA